jgi:hypothetical protein
MKKLKKACDHDAVCDDAFPDCARARDARGCGVGAHSRQQLGRNLLDALVVQQYANICAWEEHIGEFRPSWYRTHFCSVATTHPSIARSVLPSSEN